MTKTEAKRLKYLKDVLNSTFASANTRGPYKTVLEVINGLDEMLEKMEHLSIRKDLNERHTKEILEIQNRDPREIVAEEVYTRYDEIEEDLST